MTEFLLEILKTLLMAISYTFGFWVGFFICWPMIKSIIKTFKEDENQEEYEELKITNGDGKRIKKSDADFVVKMTGPVLKKLTNGKNGIKLRIRVDDNDEYGFLRVAAIHEDGSENETKIFIREFLSGDDEIIDRLKKELNLD